MTQKYYPPEYKKKQFHCILCGVFASQAWFHLKIERGYSDISTNFQGSHCSHCREFSFWYDEKMIIPSEAPIEPPHQDLPKDCVGDYLEARDIFSKSPRASVALLRLCIQKMMPHLGGKGKNINQDIGKLVDEGLSSTIQKALDVCRVVGNNAVHPGEINLKDSPKIAQQLFSLINFIIEDRITKPKEIEGLYSNLPESNKNAIEKRDKK
ncbi:DUF4145 domain-containing protein [Bathymodiolus thermophilus thioautotrophic gill symbiont]|uniref:DUF4145 domain-containing protein n=1 Tax=Bathymodiolus thermophilus thioautotrophic gill symbiont TaxID=2360 RepID=A0A1J5UHW4_9GAMM|nr:DUF4145 domain-containing protein [Bathymodiolus thermophilus thioautotrophic gill symbiont]OIR25493.1 hypothetical protein BGC33_06760 [Bathymodiolus thermophilus thioautotrophic gill symbiont]